MLQHIDYIILPYMLQVRKQLHLVMINQQLQLMTNLKGRSQKLSQLFLRPTISMHKEFQQRYSEYVMKELEGQDISDVETAKIQPIDLGQSPRGH